MQHNFHEKDQLMSHLSVRGKPRLEAIEYASELLVQFTKEENESFFLLEMIQAQSYDIHSCFLTKEIISKVNTKLCIPKQVFFGHYIFL